MRNLCLRKLIFPLLCHIYHVLLGASMDRRLLLAEATTQRRLYSDTFRGRLLLFSGPEFIASRGQVSTQAKASKLELGVNSCSRRRNEWRSEFNQTAEILRKTAALNTFRSVYVQSDSLGNRANIQMLILRHLSQKPYMKNAKVLTFNAIINHSS